MTRARDGIDSRIVLMEPTPYWCDPDLPLHAEIKEVCQIVKDVAREFDVEFCPLHEAFKDRMQKAPEGGWMSDNIHPSPRGHAIIAHIVLEFLGW
jgi:lysophospholipase L1-like esterase